MRMIQPAEPLTFATVDGLGFAAARGLLRAVQESAPYSPTSLGPLLELLHLAACGRLPLPPGGSWFADNGAGPMIAALKENLEFWVNPHDRRMGFIRAVRKSPDGDARFTGFLMDAKRAATNTAQLPGNAPAQLAAAMGEMESNIHEHSEAPETGLLAFRAAQGTFEFVAVDRGIGILKSLCSCDAYAAITDHGKALTAALSDGVSRFGEDSQRGHGFRQMFLGLLDLYGTLRFRSGDYALLMDGSSPDLTTAQLAQKPAMDGFFVSIRCRVGASPERPSHA
jgi:hypothetical protein